MAAVRDFIDRAGEALKIVEKACAGLSFDAGEVHHISGALYALCLNHCFITWQVFERGGGNSSGYALLRCCAETGIRSLYVRLLPEKVDIAKFKSDAANPFGTFREVVSAVRSALKGRTDLRLADISTDRFYAYAADYYSMACSFTHGGWQQVSRYGDEEGWLNPQYSDLDIAMGVVTTAEIAVQTTLVHLACAREFERAAAMISAYNKIFNQETKCVLEQLAR